MNFNQFNLLAKGIAALTLIVALGWAWHEFTGHYINIGKAEIQGQWDKQKAADVTVSIALLEAVRVKEHAAEAQQAAVLNSLQESHQNEIQARDKTITDLNSGARRMRVITSPSQNNSRVPNASAGATIHLETCSVRLPSEIGDAAIGIGSDANDAADQLRACQAILIEDRKICN